MIAKPPSGRGKTVTRLQVGTPSARPPSAVGFPSLSNTCQATAPPRFQPIPSVQTRIVFPRAFPATLTPDLATGWPDWRFVVYFGLHGAVVAAASLVAFGVGPPLVQGAAWRVFLVTNVYATAVGAVDAVWGMNFLYLCGKPQAPTLLDGLGPWPANCR